MVSIAIIQIKAHTKGGVIFMSKIEPSFDYVFSAPKHHKKSVSFYRHWQNDLYQGYAHLP
jgi:hypothetical protein